MHVIGQVRNGKAYGPELNQHKPTFKNPFSLLRYQKTVTTRLLKVTISERVQVLSLMVDKDVMDTK